MKYTLRERIVSTFIRAMTHLGGDYLAIHYQFFKRHARP